MMIDFRSEKFQFLLKIEMKLKEIDRTGHVAWSPAKIDEQKSNGNYFIAGTAAQQLDASFRFVFVDQCHSHRLSLVPILN